MNRLLAVGAVQLKPPINLHFVLPCRVCPIVDQALSSFSFNSELLSEPASTAESPLHAIHGIEFMQEIVQLSQQVERAHTGRVDRLIQLVSTPVFGREHFIASPAQFGLDLLKREVIGQVVKAEPYNGCTRVTNAHEVAGQIALARRGDCMFQEKAMRLQEAGAIAIIIIDNNQGTSISDLPLFIMSADHEQKDLVLIPALFLFHYEGQKLLNRLKTSQHLTLRLSDHLQNPLYLFKEYLLGQCYRGRRRLASAHEASKSRPATGSIRTEL